MKRFYWFFLALLFIPSLLYSIDAKRVCLNDGEVTIYWTKLNDTCDGFQDYNVMWRQSSSEDFSQLFTVGDYGVTSITQDPNNIGNFEEWEYYVSASYECGGNTVSENSDTIKIDNETPETIGLDSISVVNGEVVLGWSEHPNEDIKGYNIYYIDSEDNNTRLLDTVEGRFSSFYTDDSLSNPGNGAENFSLGAFDSCNNGSPISDVTHSTVYLTIDADSCQGRAEITWSAYEGWDVDHYKVFVEGDDGQVEELTEIQGNSELSYTITPEDVKQDVRYEVFVRAVNANDNSITSSSNRVGFSNNILEEPEYVYLSNVSVVDSNIKVDWISKNAQDIGRYEIYRSQDRGGFSQVGSVKAKEGEESAGNFTDSTADPYRTSYFYRIRAIDICGQFVENSNISNSIYLILRNQTENSLLRWNQYQFWEGGVDHYNIYRTIDPDDEINWNKVGQVPFDELEFRDTTELQEEPEEEICYRVEAAEGDDNPLGPSRLSHSNVVCFYQEAVAHVPNAFRPEGETNTTFNLKGLFIDYDRTEMFIYNRWGERVYHTEGIEKGWDGTNRETGELAQAGIYLYMIRLIGKDGQTETLKGTVQLLR